MLQFRYIVNAKAAQDEARQTLEDLDKQFVRGEADQQRARSNLQSIRSGDTKARFEKLLNGTEEKLESVEQARAEQLKIIDAGNATVAAIVRSF